MWWFFLLLLIIAVFLAPLIWAMFRVSRLRFTDSRGQMVDPEQVPEPILLRLKEQVGPLINSGFEYLGMRQESRGDGNYWQAFLTSAGGAVWAIAEESDELDAGRRVKMVSFGSDGSVAMTSDGEGVFGAEWPGAISQRGSYGSALEQAESHAAFLAEEQVPVAAVDPEFFLKRYEVLSLRSLDSLFQRGMLQETKEDTLEVPLLKLPQVAMAWGKYALAERARKKSGSSWLLGKNLGEEVAEEPPREEGSEDFIAEEESAAFEEQAVLEEEGCGGGAGDVRGGG